MNKPALTIDDIKKAYKRVQHLFTCPICKKEMGPVIMYACKKHGVVFEDYFSEKDTPAGEKINGIVNESLKND